jgi:hypothetical protein
MKRGSKSPAFPVTERKRRDWGRKKLTCGSRPSVRERGRGREAGLARLGWVTGRYLGPGLAQVAEAFSSLFFCSETFLFSVFYFLYIFCKHTSIQIKLLPEFFKKSAHHSKSIIKQVFK